MLGQMKKTMKLTYVLVMLVMVCCMSACFTQEVQAVKTIKAGRTRNTAGKVEENKTYKVKVTSKARSHFMGGLTFIAPDDGYYEFWVRNVKSINVPASKDTGNMELYLQDKSDLKKTDEDTEYYTEFDTIEYGDYVYSKSKYYIKNVGAKALCNSKANKKSKKKYRYYRDGAGYIHLKKGEAYVITVGGYNVGKKGFTFYLTVSNLSTAG